MKLLLLPGTMDSVGPGSGGDCTCNAGGCYVYSNCGWQTCGTNNCMTRACVSHCWAQLCSPRFDPNSLN